MFAWTVIQSLVSPTFGESAVIWLIESTRTARWNQLPVGSLVCETAISSEELLVPGLEMAVVMNR